MYTFTTKNEDGTLSTKQLDQRLFNAARNIIKGKKIVVPNSYLRKGGEFRLKVKLQACIFLLTEETWEITVVYGPEISRVTGRHIKPFD